MSTTQKTITNVLLGVAASATPLDGTTAGRTHALADMPAIGRLKLTENCDCVSINAFATGSDGNSAVFKIWGYSKSGPAKLIYAGTGTLGTSKKSGTQLYVDTFTADLTSHISTVRIGDSAQNRVASIAFDTVGFDYLVFEAATYTTLTYLAFDVQQIGIFSTHGVDVA